MQQLTAPIWSVTVGEYAVSRLHRFEVTSSRVAPVDLAQIRVPVAGFPTIEAGAPVTIGQGYRESGLWDIFTGTVRRVEPSGDELIVHAADPLARVLQMTVSRSFTGATPQEIVRWLLGSAGVSQFTLTTRRYPPGDRFVANGTIGSVLRNLAAGWGIQADIYWLPDVGVWWGPAAESPRARQAAATVEYGRSIRRHHADPGGQSGQLTVVAMPLFHSQLIQVVDPRVWPDRRTVRIDRITYRSRPAEAVIEWSLPETS